MTCVLCIGLPGAYIQYTYRFSAHPCSLVSLTQKGDIGSYRGVYAKARLSCNVKASQCDGVPRPRHPVNLRSCSQSHVWVLYFYITKVKVFVNVKVNQDI
jgi:hypothetical protein